MMGQEWQNTDMRVTVWSPIPASPWASVSPSVQQAFVLSLTGFSSSASGQDGLLFRNWSEIFSVRIGLS